MYEYKQFTREIKSNKNEEKYKNEKKEGSFSELHLNIKFKHFNPKFQ